MPQANVEVCRRMVETLGRLGPAFGQEGLDPEAEAKAREFFDPEVELIDPDLPGGGRFQGHARVLKYFEELAESFDIKSWEVERLFDAGERVVGFLHARMRGKGTGIEVEIHDAHVWTLRDGKIVHWRTYLDRKEALADAGLSGATASDG